MITTKQILTHLNLNFDVFRLTLQNLRLFYPFQLISIRKDFDTFWSKFLLAQGHTGMKVFAPRKCATKTKSARAGMKKFAIHGSALWVKLADNFRRRRSLWDGVMLEQTVFVFAMSKLASRVLEYAFVFKLAIWPEFAPNTGISISHGGWRQVHCWRYDGFKRV